MSAAVARPPARPPALPTRSLAAVLLDLDGTLLDTAPDLTHALNALRAEHGLPPLALETVRPHVSHGSSAVVRVGFADAGAEEFEALRARFLTHYRANLLIETRLFDGFAQVLDALDAHHISWGIVTNKPGWLTTPLLAAMGLDARAGCVVSGDSLPVRKPDPLPLLHAARMLRASAADCCYVGDALRDAQAAQAAGMVALGALYGYIDVHEELDTWPVTAWLHEPLELLAWVGLANYAPAPSTAPEPSTAPHH